MDSARLSNAAEHIKKKLPSMYHQFKQLADIDITKTDGRSTTHYIMGGVRWMPTRSTVPACSPRANAAGINRQPARRQLAVDLLVFGKRKRHRESRASAGRGRAVRSKDRAIGPEPFERGGARRTYQVQCALQEALMQDLVGIVDEQEMQRARALGPLRDAPGEWASPGTRVQPGMARPRPPQPADRFGGSRGRRSNARETAADISARIIPKDGWGRMNIIVRKGATDG